METRGLFIATSVIGENLHSFWDHDMWLLLIVSKLELRHLLIRIARKWHITRRLCLSWDRSLRDNFFVTHILLFSFFVLPWSWEHIFLKRIERLVRAQSLLFLRQIARSDSDCAVQRRAKRWKNLLSSLLPFYQHIQFKTMSGSVINPMSNHSNLWQDVLPHIYSKLEHLVFCKQARGEKVV